MDGQEHIPLYKRLTEWYRLKIITQEYKPGCRIDSITKMMGRHQISRETAKKVIKLLVEENLVVSQTGRGTYISYTPSIIKKWGMVIPFYSSNIEQLIAQLNKEASKQGRKLEYFLHYNNPQEEMRTVGRLIRHGYEAIIIVPNYDESVTGEFYRRLNSGKTKIVLADNTMAGSYFKYVIQSYDLGIKRAVDYLTRQHDGNFLLVSNEKWLGRNLVFDLMKQTFELLMETRCPGRQVFYSSNINELTQSYFQKNNIRGVLTIQDSLAIRVIGRLKTWGFAIPQEITLVSYGNTELTEFFTPAITVIDCKYDQMADRIAGLIHNETDRNKSQIIIQPELIIRET